jgi:hypothetical protein
MRSFAVRSRFLTLASLSVLALAMAPPASVAAAQPPITFGVAIGVGHILRTTVP